MAEKNTNSGLSKGDDLPDLLNQAINGEKVKLDAESLDVAFFGAFYHQFALFGGGMRWIEMDRESADKADEFVESFTIPGREHWAAIQWCKELTPSEEQDLLDLFDRNQPLWRWEFSIEEDPDEEPYVFFDIWIASTLEVPAFQNELARQNLISAIESDPDMRDNWFAQSTIEMLGDEALFV